MSFQGIRKIRDFKRQSPSLFAQEHYNIPMSGSHQINMDSLPISRKQLHKTKDSDFRGDSTRKQTRKSSFGMNSSREKEKKLPLMGNFMHINIEGLKTVAKRVNNRNNGNEYPWTDRPGLVKYNTQMLNRQSKQEKSISLASFNRDFVVGKGGFGKVWKVYDKKTNKIYAMKQMLKTKIINKKSVHSVMNQKRLLQNLKNPFLVNMIYAFQNKQNLFLIMDYCNRGDLRYHLGNRRKFKQDQARFFIGCILLCIEYLHSRQIIHRDLKPENLVFDQKGYLRITDLGVSREVKPNNSQDTSGTPGYMAPEVICKMNHSYPVDYFAIGVIAYQMMMGKRPYVGQNRKEIRQKILTKQVQLSEIPPFGWSVESVDFINKLIIRRPQNRLGTNGIHQVKNHPWFKKLDWELLETQKLKPPFVPPTIQQDYQNYKECISEDTEINDRQESALLLRHPDTQKAFVGYQFNLKNPMVKKAYERQDLQAFMHTTSIFNRRQK